MKRAFITAATLMLAATTALAQNKPIIPMSAVSEKSKLIGRKQAIYVLRQLDLTKEQRTQARGLLESTVDAEPEHQISLEQVYSLMQQMQEAKNNKDKEREAELTQQLRALGKSGSDNFDEFYANLNEILTKEQKAKLAEARERIKSNPSGAIRPIDVFRETRKLKLDSEQQEKLLKLQEQFSQIMSKTSETKDKERFQIMNTLLSRIKKILNDEQNAEFDLMLARLRPDLAYRLNVLTEEEEQAFMKKREQKKDDEEKDVETDE